MKLQTHIEGKSEWEMARERQRWEKDASIVKITLSNPFDENYFNRKFESIAQEKALCYMELRFIG